MDFHCCVVSVCLSQRVAFCLLSFLLAAFLQAERARFSTPHLYASLMLCHLFSLQCPLWFFFSRLYQTHLLFEMHTFLPFIELNPELKRNI